MDRYSYARRTASKKNMYSYDRRNKVGLRWDDYEEPKPPDLEKLSQKLERDPLIGEAYVHSETVDTYHYPRSVTCEYTMEVIPEADDYIEHPRKRGWIHLKGFKGDIRSVARDAERVIKQGGGKIIGTEIPKTRRFPGDPDLYYNPSEIQITFEIEMSDANELSRHETEMPDRYYEV